jgi:hypothetical protein
MLSSSTDDSDRQQLVEGIGWIICRTDTSRSGATRKCGAASLRR